MGAGAQEEASPSLDSGVRRNDENFNVKETAPKATENLTSEGHWFEGMANQATAGMKPKRVSALIQRGALRRTESAS